MSAAATLTATFLGIIIGSAAAVDWAMKGVFVLLGY